VLSVSFLADTALAEPLREIVSAAYDEGEAGLWRPGHARISVAAVAALIERGELAAACEDGRPLGCVRVSRADARTGEFGLIAAARDATNRGVGRALVAFAEDTARARGATAMRLELLVPRDGRHPGEAAAGRVVHAARLSRHRADGVRRGLSRDAPRLAVPCDLVTYAKPLG
jgi:GNAT superfamily N-acetyltransferase